VTVRLLLDEMYPASLADALRAHDHDVQAIVESAELRGCDDATVLQVASEAGRCLVTENVRDFALLARHSGHAGVLFVHGRRWPRSAVGISRLAVAIHHTVTDGRLPGMDELGWLSG
jgi:hypothetical protein